MNRDQKQEFVADLHQTLGGVQTVVVAHYKGLTVADLNDLRAKMGEVGAAFRVTKNRLTRLALEGTNFEGLADLFTGPTGVAISEDPVAAAKIAVEFAKGNDKFVILGGAMNETILDVDGIKALASMPSLDELRGKIVGMLNTPATRIAGVLQAPAGKVARVMSAYAAKDEAA